MTTTYKKRRDLLLKKKRERSLANKKNNQKLSETQNNKKYEINRENNKKNKDKKGELKIKKKRVFTDEWIKTKKGWAKRGTGPARQAEKREEARKKLGNMPHNVNRK